MIKRIFLLFFVVFAAMYAVAQGTLEHPPKDNIVRLRWATDDNPARKVQTAKFAEMFPGTQVTVDPGLGGDQTKLIVQCTTGTGPDIVDVYGKANTMALVEAGALLDLTPFAKEMGFDASKTFPAVADALKIDGKQYRFPCNINTNCVIYNKKIFDDHGVPYPKPGWTYDDFINTCKQLRDNPSKSGQQNLPIANWGGLSIVQDIMAGSGVRYFTPDGLKATLDTPEAIASLQLYYEMMHVHKVIPTPAEAAAMSSQGGWGSVGLNWFSSGRCAMILIGRWYIIQVPNYPELKGNLGCELLPQVGNRPSCGVADTRAAAVNAKSPHWREALKFLQYLASPEYSSIIVHDGDALPPNPAMATSGEALKNDIVPDPAFHAPYVQAMKNAVVRDYSSFLESSIVERWMGEAVEKVENKILPPEQAMKNLTSQINQLIRVNLERRPDLQRQYEQVTGKKYSPDWWRTYPN